MKLKGKILATGLFLGISAGFMAMIPTSHHTSAAIAVIDQRNIEEAIKTAIQTAQILTEEQKQLALQILNMKKLDISMLETLMKRNEEKEKIPLSGDVIYPDSLLKKNESLEKIWNERIGNIEDVINGNITVYDAVMQEQKRQKAIHQSAKETVEVAKETKLVFALQKVFLWTFRVTKSIIKKIFKNRERWRKIWLWDDRSLKFRAVKLSISDLPILSTKKFLDSLKN